MVTILIAEDDKNSNKLICAVLRHAGYETVSVADGAAALEALEKTHVDLVISDVMMPKVDGFELVRTIRANGYDQPVLMLTARLEQRDKRAGFIAGADDYLTKPADMQELVLRVKASLRRANIFDEKRIPVGATVLDETDHSVSRGHTREELPPKEFQLLFKLLANPGRTFTRQQLLDDVWGWDTESAESTVNVHINRLRTRFADWPDFEIQTVRGLGYRAVVNESE